MKYVGNKSTIIKVKPEIKKIKSELKKKYDSAYGFQYCVHDTKVIRTVLDLAKKYKTKKNIIIVGIGGSNLGVKAIYEALGCSKKVLFADTVDSVATSDIFDVVKKSPKDALCIIISKSGTTLETVVQTEILFGFQSSYVIITSENTPLWIFAKDKKIPLLEIPSSVGGRYSVFSPVGLFPLAVMGVNIKQFIAGAKNGKKNALSLIKNNSAESAVSIYNKKKSILECITFSTSFESIGKWYRQLFAESLGKQYNNAGKEVRFGITPMVAVGSTDLHSMGQLYFGGPKNKFFTLLIPDEKGLYIYAKTNILPFVHKKTTATIMNALSTGFEKALQKNNLPYNKVTIRRHPYDIGEYMMYKCFEILYIAYLAKVNPFDQPQVEQYKTFTREALK